MLSREFLVARRVMIFLKRGINDWHPYYRDDIV